MTRDRLLAVDAASLYFRAFHGVPTTLRAPDGMPVNAVRGFLDAVARFVSEQRPAAFVAALDADWRPQWRVDLVPSYKAHRVATGDQEEVPDELAPQVPVLLEVLEALGLACVGVPGFEADDVLGTYVERWASGVDVLTGDRDLFQLVDDERSVRVLYTGRGLSRVEVVDDAWVQERYGIPARHYADFAALRGDPSDGLPGVKGVGDKSAAAVVRQLGSLEQVVQALDDPSREVPSRAKLQAARDQLPVLAEVVRVRRDVPLPDAGTTLPRTAAEPERVAVLASRFGLETSVGRVLAALEAAADGR